MAKETQEQEVPLYPDIQVKLVGEDGNAYAIMGRVTMALERAGVEKAEVDKYMDESMAGDYNNLLNTASRWVSCDKEEGLH